MKDESSQVNETFKDLEEVLRGQSIQGRSGNLAERSKTLAVEAVLTGVQTIFYTRDDNKDSDTRLECWINLAGEREAAYGSTYGEFSDWSTHVLYLNPKTNVMRKSDIAGSWLQVRIHPNGNDSWRFTCECTLYFSDGSVYKKVFGDPTTLDQGARQLNKYL